MQAAIRLTEDVRRILQQSIITATTAVLPAQLDRPTYEAVNKVLLAAGGKWNRHAKAHLFTTDPRQALGLAVDTGTIVDTKKALQQFYTPPDLATRMVALADLHAGDRVLEPSAGTGQLLGAITHGETPVTVIAIEINQQAGDLLRAQRDTGAYQQATICTADFLTCTVEEYGLFDVVVMNPPFAKGQDVQHVTHALTFLKPGGRLVAVMSAMAGQRATNADKAFMALLESQEHYRCEALPAGTFHDSGTEVHTKLLCVTTPRAPRPTGQTPPPTGLVHDALALSSGTLATLTRLTDLATLDTIQTEFVHFCTNFSRPDAPWNDAWQRFWYERTGTPTTLDALAAHISTAATQTQAQITLARVEAETRTKLQPSKPQAPPVGLFAQTQLTIW